MGSTFYSAYNSPKTYADEKKEVETVYSNGGLNEILQTSRVGNIWYMAVRVKETGEVFAGVCKTMRERGEWGYKSMTEHSLPYYFDAPRSLLNKLTDTKDEDALKWRETCNEVLVEKENKKKFIARANMKFDVKGLFGKYRGQDIETLVCVDAQNRRYHCPEIGITFTLRHKQVSDLASRLVA